MPSVETRTFARRRDTGVRGERAERVVRVALHRPSSASPSSRGRARRPRWSPSPPDRERHHVAHRVVARAVAAVGDPRSGRVRVATFTRRPRSSYRCVRTWAVRERERDVLGRPRRSRTRRYRSPCHPCPMVQVRTSPRASYVNSCAIEYLRDPRDFDRRAIVVPRRVGLRDDQRIVRGHDPRVEAVRQASAAPPCRA